MITLQDIRGISGAEFYNLKFKTARTISTDSRTARGGEIFFALRGEKFNGHDYVSDAIGKKVACAIVDRRWYKAAVSNQPSAIGYPLVVVDDTTQALGSLARIYRRKFSMPVIAIGGSNGKTTTKEMAAKVLGKRFSVAKTSGNHNNQIGVPLTIFGFKKHHDVAVVEIGTNHFGEIRRLCEILQPDAGLIANIGAEHLEFFKNMAGVKKEESALFDFLTMSNGIAFINVDDANIVSMSKLPRHRFSYGFQTAASVRRNLSGRLFGMDKKGRVLFEMRYDGKSELVRLTVPGIHNALNALAAAAIGYRFGISSPEVRKALESYQAYEKRMQLVEVGGVKILNDTYNSNPESAIAGIHWLSVVSTKGRRIAVLADMLELGESAVREHQRIGEEIAKTNVDYLFTFGNLSKEIAAAADFHAKSGTMDKLETEPFDDKQKLSEKLLLTVAPGDVLLVKGSRGMKMEDVVNALTSTLQSREVR